MAYKLGNGMGEKWLCWLVWLAILGMLIYLTIRQAQYDEKLKKLEGYSGCR